MLKIWKNRLRTKILETDKSCKWRSDSMKYIKHMYHYSYITWHLITYKILSDNINLPSNGWLRINAHVHHVQRYWYLQIVFKYIEKNKVGADLPRLLDLSKQCVQVGREGIMAYECNPHSSNINNLTPCRFVADSWQMTLSRLFRGP